jgi:dissimilatory sulfite reductase (desulfoviridin) alpha/beta subunit
VLGNKPEKELETMMPRDNEPGTPLVIIEACHNKLSNCPNALIDTDVWRGAVEEWVAAADVSERLRARVKDNKILFHHKFRISIAGCPNSCSRPQIADVGVVGCVRPDVSPGDCTVCGACEDACPDGAIAIEGGPPLFDRLACYGCRACTRACPNACITTSEPEARILAGGKLGRHPHLADTVGKVANPQQLTAYLDMLLTAFLKTARPGERFADCWQRALHNDFSDITRVLNANTTVS